jgi:Glycosyl transferase family 8
MPNHARKMILLLLPIIIFLNSSSSLWDVCEYFSKKIYFRSEINYGSCKNKDFSPEHKISVVSFNTGGDHYLDASSVLALSILKMKTPPLIDLVMFELETKPLSSKEQLESMGWKFCTVEKIHPPRKPHERFEDQFTKLHVWNMTFYDAVIYMDSDTLVLGSIQKLIDLKIPSEYPIAATKDFRENSWCETFNLGVFKVYPNEKEFKRLENIRVKNQTSYEAIMSEQGWLNEIYPKWFDFGMENNFNIYSAIHQPKLITDAIQIVHFTMPKPWECIGNSVIQMPCTKWHAILNMIKKRR